MCRIQAQSCSCLWLHEGMLDFGPLWPKAHASMWQDAEQEHVCRPVCTVYGADIGYDGDNGAVTQSDNALLLLGCSETIQDLDTSCVLANATSYPDSEPCSAVAAPTSMRTNS